jgi:hypothetical protein
MAVFVATEVKTSFSLLVTYFSKSHTSAAGYDSCTNPGVVIK